MQIYAQRMEELEWNAKSKTPSADPQPKTSKKTSGGMQLSSESDSEWDGLSITPAPSQTQPTEMTQMMTTMMQAFSGLKVQLEGLQQANQDQQVSLHQVVGAMNGIQQNQDHLDRRLNELEGRQVHK